LVIVIDASLVVDVLIAPDSDHLLDYVFKIPDLVAPHVVDIEVLSSLRHSWLRRLLSDERLAEALEDFAELQIERYAHMLLRQRIWSLRANVTAADAAYVALAEVLDVPLITRDRRLARSSGHTARIEFIE
jgi:predicted nucleic acid-binding protein